MNLLLVREILAPGFTLGRLYIDNRFFCYTAEDTDRKLEAGGEKVYGETAIPRGRYTVKVTWSNRFRKPLPLVLDVPQFDGIRFHGGNHPNDPRGVSHGESLGCVLVGRVRTADGVAGCKETVSTLIERIDQAWEAGETVTLEVK